MLTWNCGNLEQLEKYLRINSLGEITTTGTQNGKCGNQSPVHSCTLRPRATNGYRSGGQQYERDAAIQKQHLQYHERSKSRRGAPKDLPCLAAGVARQTSIGPDGHVLYKRRRQGEMLFLRCRDRTLGAAGSAGARASEMVAKLPATAPTHHKQCAVKHRSIGPHPAGDQLRYLRFQRLHDSGGAEGGLLRRRKYPHVTDKPVAYGECYSHCRRKRFPPADELDCHPGNDSHPGQWRCPAGVVSHPSRQWQLFSRVSRVRRGVDTAAHLRGVAEKLKTKAAATGRGGFLLHGRWRSRPLLQLRWWSQGLGRQRRALGAACLVAKPVPFCQADEGSSLHRYGGCETGASRREGGEFVKSRGGQQPGHIRRGFRGGQFWGCAPSHGSHPHLREDSGGVSSCASVRQQQRSLLHTRGEAVQDLLRCRIQYGIPALRPCGGLRQVRLLRNQVPAVPETLHRCDACIFFLRTQTQINVNQNFKKKLCFNRRSQRPAVGKPGSWPLHIESLVEIERINCNISLGHHLYGLFIIKLTYNQCRSSCGCGD
ncbi:uncharacterized protein LOC108038542 isoform X1 [Drosophila rhopaloa]|uniref:Uncharacterized protein n=1 Tax=Drosophila rhopaloa TaxID=1041015 RepID=A0ABM5J5Z0_DRORH|nr:uncharacterized protein LOC108038542 isoform X1 [Drosophila rhopaloa]